MADGNQTASTLALVARATGEIRTQAYDSTNTHDGYSYLSEQRVKELAREAIAKHGLAPSGVAVRILSDEWVEAKGGGKRNLIKVVCRLEWDGGAVYCEGLGSGVDYGDKALMKAQTSAVREAWKNRLTIASGDDPEQDGEAEDELPPVAPVERAPEREQRQEPKQRSQGGSQRGSRVPTVPFGRNKGKAIDDPTVEYRDLQYLAEAAQKSIRDPSKAKFKEQNRAFLDAIHIEMENRNRESNPTYGAEDREPPDDDDIPF